MEPEDDFDEMMGFFFLEEQRKEAEGKGPSGNSGCAVVLLLLPFLPALLFLKKIGL